MIRALGILLLASAGLAHAQATPPDPMSLLRKIYKATEKLSYTGTFVYQQGERTEASRITRHSGAEGGTEKLEALDGSPREVVRTRDSVRCYLPESQTVKVDRRVDARAFPAVLPERVSDLAQHYEIRAGERARIAGFDCVSVLLVPKDELRYGHQLWADAATGMLLRARTITRDGGTIEQFTFTQLAIGNIPRERVRPRNETRTWRVIEDSSTAPASLERAGWTLGGDLPGFRKITEVMRRFGEARPVNQLVYSDGLAAVSVFIEPLTGRGEAVRPGLSTLGAINIYTREVANHVVTVVGETPAASVQRIGNNVEFRPRQ